MVLRIHFTPEDLARTRFSSGAQPMWELILSTNRLRGRDLLFDGWRRSVAARAPATTRLLTDLAPLTGYFVDFLTPTAAVPSLDEGLETLRRTTRQRLRTDLGILAGNQPLPPWTTALADGRPEALRTLVEAAEQYFAACVAPYWSRVRARVDQERARMITALAEGGWDAVLGRLHPTARWRYPVLEVGYPTEHDLHLGGRGLQLVPSFFSRGLPTTFRDTEFEPTLVYPIEHVVGWSEPNGDRKPLAALLGRTRARVLEVLGECPGTTSDVASRTGTSLPTASQQAATLRGAGLVDTRQNGQSVLHSITPLGRALLNESLP
ncbi:winged helix-turn-helix domain-containing protein [Actinophytocola sp.]|uniref:ArsR/SmtB family transcription factor n=1 Tax=Actinophytocola sp. TaxID=1872138 RepID=UPI002D22C992|nr:winged helix-turn-helix domain-containing protein [Actinophytocola sp.]HYQ66994.1 winged helix-turn-helix domain-containing protein [Actinophytocola sp.]